MCALLGENEILKQQLCKQNLVMSVRVYMKATTGLFVGYLSAAVENHRQ